MPQLFTVIFAGLSALFLVIGSGAAAQAEIDSDLLDGMSARAIGPATMSGRVAAIDAVEADPNIIYVGAATGGVWKSVNGGLNWQPIFDDQDVASIGAVAIFQAAPEIVWVGTGEGNVRNSTSIGGGIYKTMDGGRTWAKLGLERTERINRIALHPTNPDIAYVAALGTLWGENEDRGIYKTINGGKSWQKILYVDQTTGATDIKIDPANPDKLYAAMWEFRRKPYHFNSGGPGSGLYLTYDGGATWSRKTQEDGLPEGVLGRIVIAPSPSDPARVYALVEAKKSALLRSDDGGETWTTTNDETNIAVRPFYYTELLVDPEDPDTIYNIASRVSVSIDAGKTFEFIPAINCCSAPNQVHIDVHALWVNSRDPKHMIVGNDGGLAISRDKGVTWRFVANLPLAQFYHINVDNDLPYNIYGGLQDNGTFRGPSEVWENGGIKNLHWQEIGFGDGFDASPDPEDSTRGYAMSQGGNLFRWDLRTGVFQMIRPNAPKADDGSDIELRFNWNAGFAQDPFDTATIYYGSQFLHKSTDRGRSWSVISGDLTTNNPDWQLYKETGGLTSDVTAAEFYTSITAVAPSALKEGVIWVGSDDGLVHVTRDGGASWTSIANRARGVPRNSWVPHIEPSPHDASVAFVVFDDHRRSNMKPYIYRVEDYGRRWINLTSKDISGYALSVQQDHLDPDLLFLGTEFGLYVSTSGGKGWFKWTAGVPTVSVMDMAIQERENDLVLGTHGRALYVIDDYSALRGLSESDFAARLKILSVTDGQQYAPRQSPSTRFDASGGFRAPNEPYGAVVTFMMSGGDLAHPDAEKDRARRIALRQAASDDDDSDDGEDEEENGKDEKITVTVRDATGAVIRTFKAPVQQGINRVVWGHEVDGARKMPGGNGDNADDDQLPAGPEVVPGSYKITLKYGDAEASAEARVLADPRYDVSDQDRRKNFAYRQRLEALTGITVDAVERLVDARADIDVIAALARKAAPEEAGEDAGNDGDNDDPHAALGKQAKELQETLEAIEERIRTLPDTKGYVYNDDKVSSMIGLAGFYLGSSFDAPSPAALAYAAAAERALEKAVSEVNAVFAGDVAAFRQQASAMGLQPLMAAEPLAVPAATP